MVTAVASPAASPQPKCERLFLMKAGTFILPDGTKLFISYRTIIGYAQPDAIPVYTDDYARSTSTQQHKAKFQQYNGQGKTIDKAVFVRNVGRIGFSGRFNCAPTSFA